MNRFARSTFVVLVALLVGSACSEFEVKNKPPIAVAKALKSDGMVYDLTKPVPYPGMPVVVTLDGTGSYDPDGTIKSALWLRTDAPPTVRFAGNKMVDDGTGTMYTGDPGPGAKVNVTLPEGKARYTLWVTDNDGRVSSPKSLSLDVKVVVEYHPDMACKMAYSAINPNAMCVDCVCSSMADHGCLELYDTCFNNTADPMFTTLCKDITTCAIAGHCVGSACYAPAPLCQTQIMAAGTYMGAMFPASCAGEANTNPCAAASKLGACTNYDAMMVDGPCRTVCK